MSYTTLEQSEYDGEPRELYWFMRGSDSWRYSSGTDTVTFDSQTFTPVAGLSRSNLRAGGERTRNELTLTLPRDNEVAQLFIGIPSTTPVWLYIYRLHEGDADYTIAWQGRIRQVEFKGHRATATLDNILASTKKASLRHLYQNQCNNFTFDSNCGLLEADYSSAEDVIDIDGSTLTVDSAEIGGYFKAGQVKRSNGDRRFVVSDTKVGSIHILTLLTPFEDLEEGETVTVIGGACLHSFDTCQAVNTAGGGTTDNSANYAGYPKVPRKNPFKSFH